MPFTVYPNSASAFFRRDTSAPRSQSTASSGSREISPPSSSVTSLTKKSQSTVTSVPSSFTA